MTKTKPIRMQLKPGVISQVSAMAASLRRLLSQTGEMSWSAEQPAGKRTSFTVLPANYLVCRKRGGDTPLVLEFYRKPMAPPGSPSVLPPPSADDWMRRCSRLATMCLGAESMSWEDVPPVGGAMLCSICIWDRYLCRGDSYFEFIVPEPAHSPAPAPKQEPEFPYSEDERALQNHVEIEQGGDAA